MDRNTKDFLIRAVIWVVIIVGLVFLAFWSWPTYRVWQRELSGEATLAEARWDRQVAVEEAKAALESAKLLAKAEVERAKGVADANTIIADGLGGPEGYLRYLWIQALHDNQQDVIYVATEAGLPILEAGRFHQRLGTED